MRILIVCMGGVTTGLLAKRMRKYAEEQGWDDEIMAVGFHECGGYAEQADLIFVAPQAAAYLEQIHKAADRETPVLLLGEADIIQADLSSVFARIRLYREKAERKKQGEGERERQETAVKITREVLKAGARDCLTAIGFVLACAGLLALCRWLFPVTVLDWLYQAVVGLLGLYMIVCVGYTWGKALGQNPITMTMVCFGACFMLFPYGNEGTELVVMSSRVRLGWVSTVYLGPVACPVLALVSLMAVFLYVFLRKRFRGKEALSYIRMPLSQVGPVTMTMLVFFGLRLLTAFW